MLLLPTQVWQTAHGNSPELCRRSRPNPHIMIFIFPAFTPSPFSSIASFQVKSLLTHSSSNSVMITRSSAQRSSQGTPERNSHAKASSTMMKSAGWVPSLGEHRPLLQTLHCTTHQHGHHSVHWHTSPTPVSQSTPPHQVFSAPTRWPSEALDKTSSPGLRTPCRVSCWQLDTSLAAAWQQRLCLLCLCLGRSQTWNRWLTPTVWWGRPQSSPQL